MKEIQNLEETMRHWVLRRPLPRISERLFDNSTSATAPTPSLTREFLHWFVPVTGCLILVLATGPGRMNQLPNLGSERTNGLFASVASSTEKLGHWPSDMRHSELNQLPRTTLQWTISSDLPSTIPTLIYSATNFLNR